LRFNLHGRDFWVTVFAAASLGRIGVFLRGRADYYDVLSKNRPGIEKQLGEPPAWNGDGDGWNITLSRHADASNRNDWAAQHTWLATRLEKFIQVFKPYVRA
jgi:hypothetical protein